MVVKSVVNKSTLKVSIIQSIDRKTNLEDYASGKGMAFSDLLTELETIANSGTKLNINYYIDKAVDEEKQKEIYTYLKESETDSLEDALKELGEDDFSSDEVRLMKIKFVSEFGN